MKKIIKVTLIVLICLFALLIPAAIFLPMIYKDKIAEIVKAKANENLNAVIDFKDVGVSVFKNFPNITVSVNDLSVAGVDKFKNDTLVSAKSIKATVDIMAYLRKSEVNIKGVTIEKPVVHAIILKDSAVNWDIMKPSADTQPSGGDDASSNFNMKINKFNITDGSVMFEDYGSKMLLVVDNLDFLLKGDLADNKTKLDIETSASDINFLSDGVAFLSKASLSAKAGVDADLTNMEFTFKEAELELNRMKLLADGTLKMPNDDMNIDITYRAKVPSLKSLLEMVPASMLTDVKDVQTKGEMSLNGWVKGVYNETHMPQVWAELNVKNGYIKYDRLPKSIDNIDIDAKVLFDATNDQNTNISVNRFHFELSNNPFNATAVVKTPMTDADIKATVKGKIDLASLSQALPLDGLDLKGLLNADIEFAGRMSDIEKERYDKLNLAGVAILNGFTAKTEGLSVPLDISEAELKFSPQYVELKKFDCKIGESDIQASGRLDNVLNYALKDETLKGVLQLTSNTINCNQLMSESGSAAQTATTSNDTTLSVVELPSNVDLSINTKIGKIIYDNLVLTNAWGRVGIKGGALLLDGLNANFAGGTINLSGKYNAESSKSAFTNMHMIVKNVEVKDLASSFGMFDKVLPVLSGLGGKVSLDFNFNDKLDQSMSPILMALNGVGKINADSLRILNAGTLNGITSLIGLKQTSNVLKDVKASFAVTDGKVGITPFPATLGTSKMMVGGEYGLDESLNAQIDVQVPSTLVAGAVDNLLSQVGGKPGMIPANINVGVAVGGTTKNPTFKLAKAKYMTAADGTPAPSVKEQVTEQAKQIIEEKTKDLIGEQVEKLGGGDAKEAKEAVDEIKNLFKKKKKE